MSCEMCSIGPGKSIRVDDVGNCRYCGTFITTPIMDFGATRSDLAAAKMYLRNDDGLTLPPDRVKERLNLKTSAATLGRKFRAASTGKNPELLRSYYINEQGRRIAQYQFNPDHKEAKC